MATVTFMKHSVARNGLDFNSKIETRPTCRPGESLFFRLLRFLAAKKVGCGQRLRHALHVEEK